jgi:hypothetical protein
MLEFVDEGNRIGASGCHAYLGKWRVGWVGWSRINRDDPPYKATCRLPGIKDTLGRFDTEEEARAKLVKAVEHWLKEAGAAFVAKTG